MWKIQYLKLKNFINIYAGMGKEEVILDFHTCDRVINVLVGKIGSGKTSILGHLQPFATYGTLDIRNQDDPIRPEMDGLKEIEFKHGEDIYTIQHEYKWNKHSNSHNVKSYIQLNGTELNPNGNSSSFKEIIRVHFGIEQNFLRLLRLGPNVANVINMKAMERKTFIASLLSDAEVYQMLYRHLTDDLKIVQGTLGALSKKLINLSSTDEEQMKIDLEELVEKIQELQNKLTGYQTEYFRQKGLLVNALQDLSLDQLKGNYTQNLNRLESIEEECHTLQESLDSVKTNLSLTDLMRQIGSLETEIKSLQVAITQKDEEIKNAEIEREKLLSIQRMRDETGHLEDLKANILQLQKRVDENKSILVGFRSQYAYHYLKGFIDRLSLVKMEIEELASYRKGIISKLYHSDRSVASYASKKIDMLNGRLHNLQMQVSNIRYAAEYRQMYPMYRPPLCPTESCPYFQTHPVTIQKETTSSENPFLEKILNEIDEVNAQIAEYQEYPSIQQRLEHLKETWREIKPVLVSLDALKTESLLDILLNFQYRQDWYRYDHLVSVLEKCKIQEENMNLEAQLLNAQREFNELESETGGNLDEKILENQKRLDQLKGEMNQLSQSHVEKSEEYQKVSDLYEKVKNQDQMRDHLEELQRDREAFSQVTQDQKSRIEIAESSNEFLGKMELKLREMNQKLDELNSNHSDLKIRLMDIGYTKKEFAQATEEKEALKLILDAVSTREGIPLIMVKVFLNDARGILNDLLEDVFSDQLEILPFQISETEFKIPYSVGGWVVDDIDTASQGQQAIISIALSFALIRQSMFDYNIMLLDEIDGPLYKKDRDRFLTILFKQLESIQAEQVFLITHNNTFENNPVNIILTTDELVDENANHSIMRLY